MRRMVRGAFLLLASAVLAGCRTVPTWDFRAVPARSEQDWGDRLHLERPGVRVLVGPASAFPYTRAGSAGDGASCAWMISSFPSGTMSMSFCPAATTPPMVKTCRPTTWPVTGARTSEC